MAAIIKPRSIKTIYLLKIENVGERVSSLSDRERQIALLLDGEMLVDDLIAKAGLPAGAVLAVLTMLELRGFVSRLPGKRVAPKQNPK